MKWRTVLGVGAAAVLAGILLAPSAAWADTSPTLNQTGQHILASNPGFDEGDGGCNGVTAADDKDIWVFVWPGNNKVGTITSVTITWNDGTADTSLSYPAAGTLITTGTPKIAFVTPAGWSLESGTSTVTGYTSHGTFNLTHTCAGTPGDDEEPPCVENPEAEGCEPPPNDPCLDNPDTPQCNPDPCAQVGANVPEVCQTTPATPTPETPTTPATTTTTTPGLPVTGASLTGIVAAGVALIAGGAALLFLRRRRSAAGE
jgi:LPXTG-motif cell wall-anchored protein